MMLVRLILIAVVAGLAACGGSKELTCDVGPYQEAVNAPRVQVPEGLDSLEQLRELPLPEASPRPDRPEGAPCLDRPPVITTIGTG
jgi:uncharacterized lipoprotein